MAPAAGLAHAAGIQALAGYKLSDALADRWHRDSRRPCRRRDSAPARRARLAGRPQPTLALIELARQRPELLTDRGLVDHTTSFDPRNPDPATLFIYEPLERDAIIALFDRWGEIDRSHRKLAHRGSYEGLV